VRVRIWWQPADATSKFALAAADAGTGSICAVVAENNAERVAGGVGENPEARLAFTGDTGRAQSEQPRPGTDDYPAVHVFVDPHPQYLAVELGKSARIGAVDHRLLKASDHTGIISASWSRPLPLIGRVVGPEIVHRSRHE
jgi:hypothetical protein